MYYKKGNMGHKQWCFLLHASHLRSHPPGKYHQLNSNTTLKFSYMIPQSSVHFSYFDVWSCSNSTEKTATSLLFNLETGTCLLGSFGIWRCFLVSCRKLLTNLSNDAVVSLGQPDFFQILTFLRMGKDTELIDILTLFSISLLHVHFFQQLN